MGKSNTLIESLEVNPGWGSHIDGRLMVERRNRKLHFSEHRSWNTLSIPSSDDYPDMSLLSLDKGRTGTDMLLWGEAGLLRIYADHVRTRISIVTASTSPEASKALMVEVVNKYPLRVPQKEDEVPIKFWYNSARGPASVTRDLSAPAWEEIKHNYSPSLQGELEHIITKWKPGDGGQLILWQGVPGTGKTFAVRALVRQWAPWCRISYITDTDRFFADAHYLIETILSEESPDYEVSETGIPHISDEAQKKAKEKWHLIVLEDAGELVAKDARTTTGQALSKLLNMTDGLVGQGLNILLLLTTNEEIGALHDAVSRPGRCASKIQFTQLSAAESNMWLAGHGLFVEGPKTLAELYALAAGKRTTERRKVGFAPDA